MRCGEADHSTEDLNRRDTGLRLGIGGLQCEGLGETRQALLKSRLGRPHEVVPALQDEVVGFHVVRWSFHERRVSAPQELDLQFLDDRLCDLVLHLEHIVHVPVEPLGPQVVTIAHVD